MTPPASTSPDRPRIRRSPKGERRRHEILEAAMRIFARDGYGNASIAEVAEAVGLTLPGLLHYFPSKTSMLLAVLEMRDDQGQRRLGGEYASLEAALQAPPVSWEQLLRQLREINRANAGMPGVIRVFSLLNAESLVEDHPAQAWFARRSELVLTQVARSLQLALERGEIKPGTDPDQVAAEIVAMMDGLQMLWLRRPQQVDLVHCFEAYLERLEAGLRR